MFSQKPFTLHKNSKENTESTDPVGIQEFILKYFDVINN